MFPMVYRQFYLEVGFSWATGAIACVQIIALLVPMIWMKPRIRKLTSDRLLDWKPLKDWPFALLMGGMLFGYMGVYVTCCYIQIYALDQCDMPARVASYILAITNIGSLFGRVVPNYLADEFM